MVKYVVRRLEIWYFWKIGSQNHFLMPTQISTQISTYVAATGNVRVVCCRGIVAGGGEKAV